MDKIDKVIEHFRSLREEVSAPTNALVHGKIAGTKEAGDEPPVRKRKDLYIKMGYENGGVRILQKINNNNQII